MDEDKAAPKEDQRSFQFQPGTWDVLIVEQEEFQETVLGMLGALTFAVALLALSLAAFGLSAGRAGHG